MGRFSKVWIATGLVAGGISIWGITSLCGKGDHAGPGLRQDWSRFEAIAAALSQALATADMSGLETYLIPPDELDEWMQWPGVGEGSRGGLEKMLAAYHKNAGVSWQRAQRGPIWVSLDDQRVYAEIDCILDEHAPSPMLKFWCFYSGGRWLLMTFRVSNVNTWHFSEPPCTK